MKFGQLNPPENMEVRGTYNQQFEIWESENAQIPCLLPVTEETLDACTLAHNTNHPREVLYKHNTICLHE